MNYESLIRTAPEDMRPFVRDLVQVIRTLQSKVESLETQVKNSSRSI